MLGVCTSKNIQVGPGYVEVGHELQQMQLVNKNRL